MVIKAHSANFPSGARPAGKRHHPSSRFRNRRGNIESADSTGFAAGAGRRTGRQKPAAGGGGTGRRTDGRSPGLPGGDGQGVRRAGATGGGWCAEIFLRGRGGGHAPGRWCGQGRRGARWERPGVDLSKREPPGGGVFGDWWLRTTRRARGGTWFQQDEAGCFRGLPMAVW